MRIKAWIIQNCQNFDLFSTDSWSTSDGKVIQKPRKHSIQFQRPSTNRNIGDLTTRVWTLWENIVTWLLPNAKRTGHKTPYDIQMPSWATNDHIFLELKTAQIQNRWLIRPLQIQVYKSMSDANRIYFAQLFYKTLSWELPSRIPPEVFESEFLPLCLYIFPVSFVIYLTNVVQPCGNNINTQFYALSQYRAKTFYNLTEWWHIKNGEYVCSSFRTENFQKNPNMPIYIVDHSDYKHILWHCE